jgi:hypothetical protein
MYMRDLVYDLSQKEEFKTVDNTVVEVPAAVYNKSFSSGALVPPACISGCALMAFAETEVIPVYPVVWNSRRKKDATATLVQASLGVVESWNYDALGMALWYMKLQYLD